MIIRAGPSPPVLSELLIGSTAQRQTFPLSRRSSTVNRQRSTVNLCLALSRLRLQSSSILYLHLPFPPALSTSLTCRHFHSFSIYSLTHTPIWTSIARNPRLLTFSRQISSVSAWVDPTLSALPFCSVHHHVQGLRSSRLTLTFIPGDLSDHCPHSISVPCLSALR